MPRAMIRDVAVHYQQVGSGPDLVLIHGLFCNLAFWYLTVVPKLSERFRVTVYDLRGHGLTQRTARGYRAVDLADDLDALLDHLEIERAHLVGHSFGGAVALAFSIRHAEKVRSLTFADAWVPTLQIAPLARNKANWPELQARLRRSGIDVGGEIPRVAYGFFEELARLRGGDSPQVPVRPRAGDIVFNGGRDSLALRRWWQLVRKTSAVAELPNGTGIGEGEIGKVRRPVVALFGRHSRYLPTLYGLQRTLPDCTSIIVPNAGHFFPVMNPGVLTRTVSEFAAAGDGVRQGTEIEIE